MTMPDELRRALGWLPEFLGELGEDGSLADATRAKALTLASVLPQTLDDWLALDTAAPARVGVALDALEGSVKLLTDLRCSGIPLNPDRKRQLLAVLRHQPELWWFDTWRKLHARGFAMGSYITRMVGQPFLRNDASTQSSGAATAGES